MLSDSLVEEFKKLYKKTYKEELSLDEARKQALALLRLTAIRYIEEEK